MLRGYQERNVFVCLLVFTKKQYQFIILSSGGQKSKMGLSRKALAPHSSTLAWRIPWLEEPGRLQSMGLRRVGHD